MLQGAVVLKRLNTTLGRGRLTPLLLCSPGFSGITLWMGRSGGGLLEGIFGLAGVGGAGVLLSDQCGP